MSTNDAAFERELKMTLGECQTALTAARQENADLRDKCLRAAAAIENTRRQAERDAAQRAMQRLRNVFGRLLEVADNLELVLAHASAEDSLRPGVQAALQKFQNILRLEGITLIPVEVGIPFDPQHHEAITRQEAAVEQATVAALLQSGYLFDEQVLRPARVVVTVPARANPE